MARFLTSVGILCGHETVFDYCGIGAARKRLSGQEKLELSRCSSVSFDAGTKQYTCVSWHPDVQSVVADSSYMAAPFLKEDILQDADIIHVARNPVKVINSFCNNLNYFNDPNSIDPYERFILGNVPELKMSMPQYDRAALYYVMWNTMIEESNPDLFFRIEDDCVGLLKFLNLDAGVTHYNDTKTNVFEKIKEDSFCDYKQIESLQIRNELIKMAYRYGYLYFI